MKKILTLLIIHKEDRVLLGMKKRGFGMGKWNGFGGKVEVGETIEEAAKRELFEEVGITVDGIEKMGVLDFWWKGKPDKSQGHFDGPATMPAGQALGGEEDILQVHIFKATNFSGEPTESEEMKPQWFKVSEIPYEKMWSDDKYWLPLLLDSKKFSGHFIFDDKNNIIEHALHEKTE